MSYLCFMKKRRGVVPFVLMSVLALAAEIIFLQLTDGQDGLRWILCMAAAFGMMFLFIFSTADSSLTSALYITFSAIIAAEFAAALSWQITSYPIYFGFDSVPLDIAILVLVYGLCFSVLALLMKPHILNGFILHVSCAEVFVAAILMVMIFAFSNIGFILTESPIIIHSTWALIQQRTITDFVGLAVLYAAQSRIADYYSERESAAVRTALKKQYEQYKAYESSMEMLNILRHDFRHQMDGLRGETDPEKQEAWIREMEKELSKTEFAAPTGNAVLDALIGAKLLRARDQDICLTCVADGSLLSFMRDQDICSIFGNGIDNAIEACGRVEDREKRLIHLTVTEQKQFLLITISNYCEKAPAVWSDEIPVTTKDEQSQHGFGIRSIKRAAEYYSGTASVSVDDGWFHLKVLIPLG